jgi:NAD(P)H-dependent FMN reductase
MITIVGFAGSLRQGSYNAALLRAAGARMPTGSELNDALRKFLKGFVAHVRARSNSVES